MLSWTDIVQKCRIYKVATPFKNEDSRFMLMVGIKVISIPLVIALFIGALVWVLIKMDQIFFEANGFMQMGQFSETFMDYVFTEVSGAAAYIGSFFIALFFAGMYFGALMIRPFKVLGRYCEQVLVDEDAVYNPEFFSDFRLLTRFSGFFFNSIDLGRGKGEVSPVKIPQNYMGIHSPTFEKAFFINYCLFLSIMAILAVLFLQLVAVELHSSVVKFAISQLKNNGPAIVHFFNTQVDIFNTVVLFSASALVLAYVLLAVHLYGRVSTAAFGIFSTMKSFLKGNYSARVHLIGHTHLRDHTRSINKYLDYIQEHYTHRG